ncbi:MAG: ATP phosphoribosyltransferase regulatory subunit [Clostridiaceae bacterium]
MSKWKNYIPEGSKDILFSQCTRKNNIINKFRELFLSVGYEEVQTPTLEYYDVFDFENQPINQEKMYKFFDSKGRILVLRPDFTIPIARVFSNKIKNSPTKLCYSGEIFRANEVHYGKNNEITQSGVEILGISNYKAEVEAIKTAIEALKEIGIDDFKIEIGQSNFYKSIIEGLSLEENELEELRELIENKNIGTLAGFLKSKSDRLNQEEIGLLKKLPQLFGGIEILDLAQNLTNNDKAQNALNNIKNIYEALDTIGYSKYLNIDLGMIQNFDYYTGVIFKGYVNELGEEILSGGRYDNLISEFGEKTPAVGLGINVDNILSVLKEESAIDNKYYIQYDESGYGKANDVSKELKSKGNIVQLSLFDSLEEAMNYCKDKGMVNLIEIKNNEVIKYIYNDGNFNVQRVDV